MAQVQRVQLADGATWTVIDAEFRVVGPVEEFLEHLRNSEKSPNTVRSYAKALALWWTFLDRRGASWTEAGLADFGSFLQAVRSGTVESNVSPMADLRTVADGTVAVRVRAVMSFYRFQTSNGVGVAADLYEQVRLPNVPYLPLLEHVSRRHGRIRSKVRLRVRRNEAPILTPAQIEGLLDREARWDAEAGSWIGDLRYRFLWAFLEETGARIGEALCVRHCDWVPSRGGTPYVKLRSDEPHPHGLRHKTGYRKVHISARLDSLYSAYVWWLVDLGADLHVDDFERSYLFVNVYREPKFAPMRMESVTKHLAVMKRRLGLPAGMTTHWFRHTHATALLLSGTPIHVVSRRLGHADVQTALNTYGHVTDDAELAALANWQDYTRGWLPNG